MSPSSPANTLTGTGTLRIAVCAAAIAAASAVQAAAPPAAPPPAGGFRASEAFTFLFLAMGPIPIIPAFAALTDGRDRPFKRGLALYAIAVVAVAIFIAATSGVGALRGWGVSTPALVLATGLLLLLVALRTALDAYAPRPIAPPATPPADPSLPTRKELAFSPLAFPIIISPFGIGIVVLLFVLAEERGATQTLAGLILLVLVLDLLAMLLADWIMKAPLIKYLLLIMGAVMSVLQVSLAVQAIANSIRELNMF